MTSLSHLTLSFILILGCARAAVAEPELDEFARKSIPLTDLTDAPKKSGGFYVSTSGMDANPGTVSKPWRTIQKAANTLVAGQSLYILPGVYYERVKIWHSGTETKPISIFAAFPGSVKVDGSKTAGYAILDSNGQSYLRFSGLTLQNATPTGCGISVRSSKRVEVTNCHVINTARAGIEVLQCENVSIRRTQIERACKGGEEDGLSYKQTKGGVLDANVFDHNGGAGVSLNDGTADIELLNCNIYRNKGPAVVIDAGKLPTGNIHVQCNIVHDCGGGVELKTTAGGLLNAVGCENNVIYNNHGAGFAILDSGDKKKHHPLKNINIACNTVYGNQAGERGTRGGLHVENADADTITVRNNIFCKNGSEQIILPGGKQPRSLTIENNLVFGGSKITGTNAVVADPLFESPEDRNFHVRSGSPAQGAGIGTRLPMFDKGGTRRYPSSPITVGAFQK